MTNFYDIYDNDWNYLNDPKYYHETLYSWVHLSCVNINHRILFTPKSVIKFSTIDETLFINTC